jgi:hypothetical protein
MVTVHHPVGITTLVPENKFWVATSSDRVEQLLAEAKDDKESFKRFSEKHARTRALENKLVYLKDYSYKKDQVFYGLKSAEEAIDKSTVEKPAGEGYKKLITDHPRYFFVEAAKASAELAYKASSEYKQYQSDLDAYDRPKDEKKRPPKPNAPPKPSWTGFLEPWQKVIEDNYQTKILELTPSRKELQEEYCSLYGSTKVSLHNIMQKPIVFLNDTSLEKARATVIGLLLQPQLHSIDRVETSLSASSFVGDEVPDAGNASTPDPPGTPPGFIPGAPDPGETPESLLAKSLLNGKKKP